MSRLSEKAARYVHIAHHRYFGYVVTGADPWDG